MPILTPVVKLVVFRQSLRPHSAVAFLVEFLCFVLELLGEEKELAKIFGVLCAFDTLVFTLLDLVQCLKEEEVKLRKWGYVFWLYTCDGRLYWNTLHAYLLTLCVLHVVGSLVSYMSCRHYLVLVPLLSAGLELVPQEAYRVLGNSGQSQDVIGPDQGPQGLQYAIGSIQGPQDAIGLNQSPQNGVGPGQGPLPMEQLNVEIA